MKFIGKLLLYVLIALAVAILGLYFLLQTRWGAEHVSAWVSQNSSYHLAFDAIDHRFFPLPIFCWKTSPLAGMVSPPRWSPKRSILDSVAAKSPTRCT